MPLVWLDETPLPRSSRPSISPLEAAMRSSPRLGSVNAAIIALYFAPVWGGDGLRALISPFHGFEDPVHAVAPAYFRALFDLGLVGLVQVSNVLAGLKFVIAIGFLAYLIDFARAMVVGRETNRETLDAVLVFAAITLSLWAWPTFAAGDAALIRLQATQFLLLSSAIIVLVIERHMEEAGFAETNKAASTPVLLARTEAAVA
jgi:hypothetical protein